jgi:hypothetical protein
MAGTDAAVAVYWDFENVHACLLDDGGGENTYRSTAKYKPQDVVVDIARVTEYAATLGRVVLHRAYANWQYFAKYKDDLQAHAIDTVQLFPLTGAKNGADIRLALDVAEDLRGHPHITHVVVVASDSDYTALAQRCRAYGRQFVGVGTARTARGYLHACDEFRRYGEIPASAGFIPPVMPWPVVSTAATRDGTATLEDAAGLVVAAVRRLAVESGEPWVRKAAVRPMVRRLDPGFAEAAFGFAVFSDLVSALDARIAERSGKFDHELAVRADLPASGLPASGVSASGLPASETETETEVAVTPSWPGPLGPIDPMSPASLLDAELRKRKQRLPADKRLLWSGPELIAEIFAASPDGIEPSFDSLWLKFDAAATASGMAVPEADFKKLKAILWRSYVFEPLGHDQGLRLRVPDAAQLRLRAATMLLRLLPDPASVDVAVLAEVLFGPSGPAEQRELVGAALASVVEGPGPGPGPDLDAEWAHEADCPDETTGGEGAPCSAAA